MVTLHTEINFTNNNKVKLVCVHHFSDSILNRNSPQ